MSQRTSNFQRYPVYNSVDEQNLKQKFLDKQEISKNSDSQRILVGNGEVKNQSSNVFDQVNQEIDQSEES